MRASMYVDLLTQTAVSPVPVCLPANPDLDLTVEITTDIQAVPGTQKSTMDLTSYACPWVLPN